ncbi:germin-like protein 5-1 [Selaginella moellendorffii]|uniref:germin-like protein 5-1 n=1 Tax=Selaginella moellendorffii TaxID=88036 RepID=UPI000D1CA7DB|nr:germin-like protein 5-1 [Selaginella moellendorffii]|eukprot:XP_024536110.1 germin-like protein 5-1 [Selaginella moellendorffii]
MAVVISCVLLSFLAKLATCADSDPLQDICVADLNSSVTLVNGFPCKSISQVVGEDFRFRGLGVAADTNNTLGLKITTINVFKFPGLNSMGISAARADFGPFGVNPPHVHPRATEQFFVLFGQFYVGFVTNDFKLYATTLQPGDVFIFPRGLPQFQLNMGSSPASAFVSFNSQNPGVMQMPHALFASDPEITDAVLARAFGIPLDGSSLKQMKDNIRAMFPKL